MLSSDCSWDTQAFTRERAGMVERLRKHYQIKDDRVLAAMGAVPRHLFVLEAFRAHAYGDHALPLDFDQTISQPFMVARQTELLEVTSGDRVLEIGAGSGYQTAILAQVAGRVFALERIAELARSAQQILRFLGIHNTTVKCFDGTYGWNAFAPFRGILVAAAAPEIPPLLVNQLDIGGHLVIPVGDESTQRLMRIRRTREGTLTEDFGACQFVKLIGKFGWDK